MVRFLIYIKFSSHLAQSQNSRSIRLEMAQKNVEKLLFENHEIKTSKSISLPIYNILRVDNGDNRSHRWPGHLPALNPIESLHSQLKNLQRKERVTSTVGLKKRCTDDLETSHTRLFKM